MSERSVDEVARGDYSIPLSVSGSTSLGAATLDGGAGRIGEGRAEGRLADGLIGGAGRDLVRAADRGDERELFYSNCWLWAFWSFFSKRGFLLVSKSEWGWWPHVMWSPDLTAVHQFEPDHKRRSGRLWPPFIYRGYVKKTLL